MKLTKKRAAALVGYSERLKEKSMKRKGTMIGMALVAFAAVAGFAQTSQPDRVVVPLTDPAKPAFVEVQILMGSIKVTGYEGKEVIVEATVREKTLTGEREGVGPVSLPSPPSRPSSPRRPEPGTARHVRAERERRMRAVGPGRPENPDRGGARKIKARKAGLKQIPLGEQRPDGRGREQPRRPWRSSPSAAPTTSTSRSRRGRPLKLESAAMGGVRVEGVSGEIEVENMNGSDRASKRLGDRDRQHEQRRHRGRPGPSRVRQADVVRHLQRGHRCGSAARRQGQPWSSSRRKGTSTATSTSALKTAPAKAEESGTARRPVPRHDRAVAPGTINGGGVEMKFETFNGDIYIRKKK